MAKSRKLMMLMAAVPLAYAGACAWIHHSQRELLYFPQVTRTPATATDWALQRADVTLRGWRLEPSAPRPILYFGGNAESIENNRDTFANWFPGRSVYLMAYRGYGASEGTPTEQALFDDALAVYDHIAAEHPGQPVTVIGSSLGSGVAAYLASQRLVERLVLVTPYDSMANVARAHYPALPVHWLLQDRFESMRHLAGYRGQVLVLRAGRDTVIPAACTARLVAVLSQPPIVVDLPEAAHNTVRDEPRFGEALMAFLR